MVDFPSSLHYTLECLQEIEAVLKDAWDLYPELLIITFACADLNRIILLYWIWDYAQMFSGDKFTFKNKLNKKQPRTCEAMCVLFL